MRAVCRSVAALVLLLALGSCSDIPTESPSPARPSFAIADGAHGGNPHVFFLPPLLDDPSSQFSAPFDGSLDVKIVICIWRPTDKVCGPALVAFDQTTNAGSEMVRVPEGEEYYQVNWQPDAVLDQNPLGTGEAYRIQVLVGNRVAAFADLQVVGTARELKSVSTGEFIPLLGARTLPIKVRIEEGWETWGVVEVVETGGWHSCKLTTTGAAYCWGYGEYGQLGNNGKALAQTTPVPVVGNHAFTALSAGQFHTCGLTLDGTAYCWGYNAWGQLGDNSTVDMAVPVMVAAGGLRFTALTAGGNHTCALATGGAAYCWGANGRGQLGVGGFPYSRQGTPMPVAGGLAFTSLTAITPVESPRMALPTAGGSTGGVSSATAAMETRPRRWLSPED
jgi:hypothetical protein